MFILWNMDERFLRIWWKRVLSAKTILLMKILTDSVDIFAVCNNFLRQGSRVAHGT